jgi:Transglycosylase SLT domain
MCGLRRAGAVLMRRLVLLACCLAALPLSQGARAQGRAQYEKLVATHAKTNLVPEALVHRVIVRESKYKPDLIGRGGTIGLMQIKLATARGVGYKGDAEGLRDPDTNLAYGIKYLAGAWRAAKGDHDRAVHYYASGYYQVAKAQRIERMRHGEPVLASAPPKDAVKPLETAKAEDAAPEQATAGTSEVGKKGDKETIKAKPAEARADPVEAAKPKEAEAAPTQVVKPKQLAAKPKIKKLADARALVQALVHALVPRPPANIPGANAAKPR